MTNPYRRAALLLIRMVAFGFIIFGSVYLVPEFILMAAKDREGAVPIGPVILKAVPILVGLAILIKSAAIAGRLTEDFED